HPAGTAPLEFSPKGQPNARPFAAVGIPKAGGAGDIQGVPSSGRADRLLSRPLFLTVHTISSFSPSYTCEAGLSTKKPQARCLGFSCMFARLLGLADLDSLAVKVQHLSLPGGNTVLHRLIQN